MKKLMIAAAVACVAVFAQAASIDWNITGKNAVKGYDGKAVGANYDVYLVLASAASGIDEALKGGTFSTSTTGVIGTEKTSSNSNLGTAVPKSSSQLTKGKEYAFAVLVLSEDKTTGDKYYKISTSITKAAYLDGDPEYGDPQQVAFAGANFTGATWTKYATGGGDVPEPTSAMLMLLGVAGLALRRRRA